MAVPSLIGKLCVCVCRESRVGHTEQSFVGAKMLAVSVRSAMWHDLCARRECKCPACDQQTKQPTKPEDQQNWLYSPKRAPLSLSFFHPFFLPPFFLSSSFTFFFTSCPFFCPCPDFEHYTQGNFQTNIYIFCSVYFSNFVNGCKLLVWYRR